MNKFLAGIADETNYGMTYTENGALTYTSTQSALYDMFALGGAYRNRSDEDIIFLWRKAYSEDSHYALKCLFYLRDILCGQGERRFFRVCMADLANYDSTAAERLIPYIPQFGRWDDLYCFVGTKLEAAAFEFMHQQFLLDLNSKTPSLLAKWLKSENTSSKESRRLGNLTRTYFELNHMGYRKCLSVLRERIKVVERLMSENRWSEIEFDKIPSKAGLKYRNAYARRDIIKAKYESFAKSETTKVNAKALYPYECVKEAKHHFYDSANNTTRLMVNKYWDNLTDYFDGCDFNGLAVVDTSGSMTWNDCGGACPIDVAISLGIYCAERAKGPFAGHYISFASRPQLIKVEGIDFVDKVNRIYRTNLCDNTNIEATFDMLLNVALKDNMTQDDLPKSIIIISDMEFDAARVYGNRKFSNSTLMENISAKWEAHGYQMPHLIFWNVEARQDNIPMRDSDGITFVSGFSPVIYQMIMTNKSGKDLMYDKLNSDRYSCIF